MQDFYQLSTADLQRANVTGDMLARIVTRYLSSGGAEGGGAEGGMENSALLALLLRNQVPANLRYNVYGFNYTPTTFANFVVQVVPQNPNRKFLALQMFGEIAGETGYFVFEENALTPQELDDNQIGPLTNRGIAFATNRDSSDNVLLEAPLSVLSPAPTNAVSVVGVLMVNKYVRGVVIEGV